MRSRQDIEISQAASRDGCFSVFAGVRRTRQGDADGRMLECHDSWSQA